MGTKKSNKLYAAAAALAVTASAVAPGLTADAASKVTVKSVTNPASISHYGGYTFAVKKLSLPKTVKVLLSNKKYENRSVKWGKVSYDAKYIGKYQTISGTVSGTTKKASIKVKLNNYPVDVVEPTLAPVAVGEKLNLPSTIDVKYKDGKVVARSAKSFNLTAEKTDKAGEMKLSYNYMGNNSSIKGSIAYEVKAAEITNVMNEIKDDMLSVSADVKYPAKDAKVEVLVYAFKDMTKEPIKVAAELKDGKLTAKSGVLPAGTHAFAVQVGDVVSPAKDFVIEAPMVKEVKAINAKQLQVTFSKAIDASTVLDEENALKNIKVTKVGNEDSTGLKGQLSEDKKSLVITASSDEVFNGSYVVNVSDSVKTVTGLKVAAFSELVKAEDKVAPTFVSASAVAKTTTKKVAVKFDEPVVADGVIAYVNGAVAIVGVGSSSNELEITASQDLKAGEALTIRLTNVKDFAGNYTTPNPLELTTTVVADVAAPKIVTAEVYGEDSVKVTFDKALDSAQASTLGAKVRLLAANGTPAGSFANAATIDGKTAIFKLSAPSFDKDGKLAGTFYLDKGIKDSLGNETVELFTKQLSFQKDLIAPLVASVVYKDNNIVATYTEEVSITANTVVTAINKSTGKVETITLTAQNAALSADKKTVTISNSGLADGTYELRLPAGTVKDLSSAKNESAYFTTTLVVKNSVATENDTTKPVVTFANEDEGVLPVTNEGSEYKFSFQLVDNAGINFDSVLNISNYTYAGKALPANAYVTTDATSVTDKDVVVTIHVPKKSVPVTVDKGLFSVVNIKDAAGNSLAAVANTKVTLVDGVAPELKAATISSGDKTTLVVELTEEVKGLDAAADLALTVNGEVVVVSGVTEITAGTDKGKYYVTGTGVNDFNAASTITLALKEDKAQGGTVIEDIAKNKATFDQVIKVK
ncbi:Ig-like domain-containing protein [uncultured Exiguobacterium sp.]|uniref:Ig-like domain-containing protein n=1 Tax=uncultured Exiguobacterium sp. TaxID=202669 RepID=UPI0025E1CCF1|nr:Ig-like domain-containing protein [uncultured Exiguobacterium sp.]